MKKNILQLLLGLHAVSVLACPQNTEKPSLYARTVIRGASAVANTLATAVVAKSLLENLTSIDTQNFWYYVAGAGVGLGLNEMHEAYSTYQLYKKYPEKEAISVDNYKLMHNWQASQMAVIPAVFYGMLTFPIAYIFKRNLHNSLKTSLLVCAGFWLFNKGCLSLVHPLRSSVERSTEEVAQ